MPTVLVTGANRGIGLEFARQYAADAWRVIATCRDPAGAAELVALSGDVSVHKLDVTRREDAVALAGTIGDDPIDLLLLNAGAYGGPTGTALGSLDYELWDHVLRVNTMGPLLVAEQFIERVADSGLKKIVAVTSKMGSMAENTSGRSYMYRSSKAGLNAVMKSLALDLADRGIACCVVHPGWVQTAMGGSNAAIDTATSVSGLRTVIDSLSPATTGRFYNYDGSEIPW